MPTYSTFSLYFKGNVMGLHIKESALFIILIILFTPLAFVLMPVIAALIIMGALIMVLMPKRDHHQQKTM